jgi:Fibronectin type III-like domain
MVRRSAGGNAWTGFAKVGSLTDESQQMSLTLDRGAFSFYDVGQRDWSAEPGES